MQNVLNRLSTFARLTNRLEFSLNVFTEFAEFSDRNICHYIKGVSHLLGERPGCYHSAIKTHVRDMIFKLSPIHASVI